jgi:hypothetical protein
MATKQELRARAGQELPTSAPWGATFRWCGAGNMHAHCVVDGKVIGQWWPATGTVMLREGFYGDKSMTAAEFVEQCRLEWQGEQAPDRVPAELVKADDLKSFIGAPVINGIERVIGDAPSGFIDATEDPRHSFAARELHEKAAPREGERRAWGSHRARLLAGMLAAMLVGAGGGSGGEES